MYAIIQDGGRQHRVEEGQRLTIDYREGEDKTIVFDEVVACGEGAGLKVGQPLVPGAKVTAEVVAVVPGPKLVVQKLRRRKNSRRKTGHRQLHTEVKITSIELG